jgi:hypothetical protein
MSRNLTFEDYTDPNGIVYQTIQEKTEAMREQNHNPSYRNICDVIISIKNLIPEEIFKEYEPTFNWIIDDSCYRAPEVCGDSWVFLGKILKTICDKHHDFVPTEALRKCFTGEQ